MNALPARAVAGLILALCAPFLISWRAADAQTWQWQVVVHNPDRPPVNSESRVVLSGHDIVMNYAARVNDAEVPIASCHAQLPDVAGARIVNSAGGYYLYVAFKPGRSAQCQSGDQPVAVIPVANNSAASDAVATIVRACCGSAGPPVARTSPRASQQLKAAIIANATPTPANTPARQNASLPTSTPQPKSSAAPHLLVTDWTESDGLFTFIRVRNRGPVPVTIPSGQVGDCKAVAVGCGAFGHQVVLAPGADAVLATVMSADPVNDAAFSYSYDARAGALQMTRTGTSRKELSGWRPPMSAQDIRSAQAAAIAASRTSGPAQPSPELDAPARLTQRGSSRLAIGHTGQARVRVRVSAKGMPLNASIVSISNPALIAAALETAVSSSYAPAVRKGRPVDEDYIATFQFDGQDPALSQIPIWERPQSPLPNSAPSPGPT
jgi:hypothetical protein